MTPIEKEAYERYIASLIDKTKMVRKEFSKGELGIKNLVFLDLIVAEAKLEEALEKLKHGTEQ